MLGEFAEERPLSVVIADMLLSLVPGVVIVLSARDLAAVCLRLGKRYTADGSQQRRSRHSGRSGCCWLPACLL